MRAHTQIRLAEMRGGMGFVSVCCVCSQGQPQPARASPSQSGLAPASQGQPQPARARPSQQPARQGRSHQARPSQAHTKKRSGQVTEPLDRVASLGDLGVF